MYTKKSKLLIYGANGYSAGLIIPELLRNKIIPVLAGRNKTAIEHAARNLGCEYITFDLNNRENVENHIQEFHTLLNCAGPFKFTAGVLIDACLSTTTNYLDITGEIDAIEYAWRCNQNAKHKQIVIMPSVGFDVISTDCLSRKLVDFMPDAVTLELAIRNKNGKISKGTFLTTLEMLCELGKIRKDHQLVDSVIGEFSIDLREKRFKLQGISIPWGGCILGILFHRDTEYKSISWIASTAL